MNFTIRSNSMDSKATGEWSLHKAGCKDLARSPRRDDETFEAASVTDALNYWVDDELVEMGYDHDAVNVLPCAKDAS